MGRYRDTLHADIPGARAALRELLTGPIWYAHGPDGSYTLRGQTRVGALFPATGVTLASPRGFERYAGCPSTGTRLASHRGFELYTGQLSLPWAA